MRRNVGQDYSGAQRGEVEHVCKDQYSACVQFPEFLMFMALASICKFAKGLNNRKDFFSLTAGLRGPTSLAEKNLLF